MKKRVYAQVMIPLVALLIYGIFILAERSGVSVVEPQNPPVQNVKLEFTDQAEIHQKRCLLLTADDPTTGSIFFDMMSAVLDDMAIPYDVIDVTDPQFLNVLQDYSTAVITFGNWKLLGENLLSMCDWVKNGGGLMNTSTPEANSYFNTVSAKLGVASGGMDYAGITGVRITPGVMIGSEEEPAYHFSDEPMMMSLDVVLDDRCYCAVGCMTIFQSLAAGFPILPVRRISSGWL